MESMGHTQSLNFTDLAHLVCETRLESVSAEALTQGKITLLHNLTVALMASKHVDIAMQFAGQESNFRTLSARIWSEGRNVSIERAILANSAMMHARTQDDSCLPAQAHFGSTAMPALIAVADQLDASGNDLLLAICLAYEVGARAAGSIAPRVTQRGFRSSTVFGPLACAAGLSRLKGLTVAQTVSALSLAASFGGGSTQTWLTGTSEWMYQVGMAGVHGLWAMELADGGATGAPDGFEGKAGVLAVFSGATEYLPPANARWAIQDVSYKPYPICAICQTPVMAAFNLRNQLRDDIALIETIIVELHPNQAAYPGTDARGPFVDVGGSLMSAPFCVGVALLTGQVGLDDIENFTDPDVLRFAAITTVRGSEDCALGDCRVTLTLRDGRTISEAIIMTPEMFTWGKEEALRQVAPRQGETDLSAKEYGHLAELILNLERYSARDLVHGLIVGH